MQVHVHFVQVTSTFCTNKPENHSFEKEKDFLANKNDKQIPITHGLKMNAILNSTNVRSDLS